jgi:hypothetical protein
MAVCVQLFVIMLLKSLAGNILTLIIPFITQFCKKKEVDEKTPRPQWEVEFQLYPAGRFLLTTEFMDMSTFHNSFQQISLFYDLQ